MTPTNTMFADFLANIDAEGRVGRTPVDPVSTALNVYICDYAASSEDQVYFGHGALVDFGYAHHCYAQSQTPQGEGLYVFSPAGNSGNYLLNSTKRPARDQGPIHGYLPKFLLAGWHQVEPRSHADRPPYRANNRSTGYQESGLAGQLLSKTTFVAPVTFRVSDVEFSSNLPDTGIFAAAFGGGFDSANWPGNPTAVNNVPGSPQYQKFPGDEGRRCVVRVPFGSAGQTSR